MPTFGTIKRLLVKHQTTIPFLVIGLGLFPKPVFAQLNDATDFVQALEELISISIPILGGVAMLAFFFGLVKYIVHAGDEEGREAGKKVMIAGIVALFLIAAIGGIIEFIADALDIQTGQDIDPPTIMFSGGDGIG